MPEPALTPEAEKFLREKGFEVAADAKKPGCWAVRCRKCRQAWTLYSNGLSIGNRLHLTDHYRSHKP